MDDNKIPPEMPGTINKNTDASPVIPDENEELAWMQNHDPAAAGPSETAAVPGSTDPAGSTPEHRPVRRVERKTYLRGQSIDPPRRSRQSLRKRTERELLDEASGIPFTAWEKSTRSLICSLIERQDRLSEQFLLKQNDLQYRVDDLEASCDDLAVQLKRKVPE